VFSVPRAEGKSESILRARYVHKSYPDTDPLSMDGIDLCPFAMCANWISGAATSGIPKQWHSFIRTCQNGLVLYKLSETPCYLTYDLRMNDLLNMLLGTRLRQDQQL